MWSGYKYESLEIHFNMEFGLKKGYFVHILYLLWYKFSVSLILLYVLIGLPVSYLKKIKNREMIKYKDDCLFPDAP